VIGGRKAVTMGATVTPVIEYVARTIDVSSETGTMFFPKWPSQRHSTSDD
jgi:hypothetical protein